MAQPEALLASYKRRLLEVLGANAGVMLEVIPELERVIGPQPPVPEVSIRTRHFMHSLCMFACFVKHVASIIFLHTYVHTECLMHTHTQAIKNHT